MPTLRIYQRRRQCAILLINEILTVFTKCHGFNQSAVMSFP
nr:MAG TPA: hypothetical protein [Microviridae sp.]